MLGKDFYYVDFLGKDVAVVDLLWMDIVVVDLLWKDFNVDVVVDLLCFNNLWLLFSDHIGLPSLSCEDDLSVLKCCVYLPDDFLLFNNVSCLCNFARHHLHRLRYRTFFFGFLVKLSLLKLRRRLRIWLRRLVLWRGRLLHLWRRLLIWVIDEIIALRAARRTVHLATLTGFVVQDDTGDAKDV